VLAKLESGRRASQRVQDLLTEHRGQVERYEALCAELGERPSDVGLAWLLHQPAVTAPIVGPRTQAQLDESLRALELTLDDKTLAALDDIWPGPGGQAPEAYAW
jgi:aryl-alcohol dehydrogenase-like predicted oxidoreductase